MSTKKLLSWKLSILQLLKNRTLTVFELQDRYWYQKKRKFVIYKVTEFFFAIFEFGQKLHCLKFQFLGKKTFFWKKKCVTRKLKWNSKKKLCVVLYSTKIRFDWYTYQLCRLNRLTVRLDIANPLFLCCLWIIRFLWRKWKKAHDGNPFLFFILHVCANFHRNRTNDKDFF